MCIVIIDKQGGGYGIIWFRLYNYNGWKRKTKMVYEKQVVISKFLSALEVDSVKDISFFLEISKVFVFAEDRLFTGFYVSIEQTI